MTKMQNLWQNSENINSDIFFSLADDCSKPKQHLFFVVVFEEKLRCFKEISQSELKEHYDLLLLEVKIPPGETSFVFPIIYSFSTLETFFIYKHTTNINIILISIKSSHFSL